MLKGISPLISPELLSCLYRMGHGDEIIFADAHFPGDSLGIDVIRADGLAIDALLAAVLPLLELDSYIPNPVKMMAPVEGDQADPAVNHAYIEIINQYKHVEIDYIERFSFYDCSKKAFAVVMTGDIRKYGNIILTKGVTPL